MVDLRFEQAFTEILPLSELKFIPALDDSLLLKKGCEQLTVIPLEPKHWQAIMNTAESLDIL